jgi:hypothetical protein
VAEEPEPSVGAVESWLRDFVKALKGLRVYADNNQTLHRYLDDVHRGLESLLDAGDELSLSVREDRLEYAGTPVLVSDDRLDGLPFLLYRNAFRRLSFMPGMTRDELLGLMRAMTSDYAVYDGAGEDLVTALWRLQPPHLRYITIDTLTAEAGTVQSPEERREIERLQGDVEAIVAAVYRNSLTGTDIVSGLSISKEDLQALREVRDEPEEELERLDQLTERAVLDIDADERDRFAQQLKEESRDLLVKRTMEALVRILFGERSGRDAFSAIDLLQQLLDSMLLGQRFVHATELVRRLRITSERAEDLQQLHVARQLLMLFASKSRIIPLLASLNDRVVARSVSELVAFLRALGPPTIPALLKALPDVESPVHRRVIRDLIIELGVPDPETLRATAADAEWFIVRDLLTMAEHRQPEEVALLVEEALHHPHPRVREAGTRLLRNYGYGAADERLSQLLWDSDPDVRRAARRLAVTRRSESLVDALKRQVQHHETSADARELRHLFHAYAAVAQAEAVEPLSKILHQGLLSSLKSTEAPVAAAMALSSLDLAGARGALQKGARSLVPKVREACRRGLERGRGPSETLTIDIEDSSSEDLPTLDVQARPEFRPLAPSAEASVQRPSIDPRPPSASTQFHQRVDDAGERIPAWSSQRSPEPALTQDLVSTEELPMITDLVPLTPTPADDEAGDAESSPPPLEGS